MRKTCEICGSNPAMYICSECGRSVCPECFEPDSWICSDCYRKKKQEHAQEGFEESLTSFPLFMKIFLAGFLLIFLGMVILIIAGLMGGISQSFGLVVFIGPIPIILGTGKYSLLAILLAVLLTILGIILFVIFRKWGFQGALHKDIESV